VRRQVGPERLDRPRRLSLLRERFRRRTPLRPPRPGAAPADA
jgi:hypothetical protein